MRIRLSSISEDDGGQDILLQQMAMDQESQSRQEAEIMSKIMEKERHDKIEKQEEAQRQQIMKFIQSNPK